MPTIDTEIYKEALSLGFDDADASLASIGEKNSDSTIIVTEDRPFLDYLELNKISAVQFAELLQIYTDIGKIEGKVFYRLTKELQELRNITKQKMDTLLKWKAERFRWSFHGSEEPAASFFRTRSVSDAATSGTIRRGCRKNAYLGRRIQLSRPTLLFLVNHKFLG